LARNSKSLVLSAALALFALAALAVTQAPGTSPRHLERALDAQRALVAERPGDADVHNDLGNLLALAGDRRGAEAAYLRALELDPDRPGTRFNYGLLLADSDRRLAALGQLREVVDLDPGHAWAHYEIGSLYDSWGLDRLARRAYTRAFRLDPTLADARVNPDVVGNRQVTRAMLRAWSAGVYGSRAPRSYSDAGRIAGLMIDVPAEPRASEEATEWAGTQSLEPHGGFARLAEPGTSPTPRDDGDRGDELRDADELAEDSSATASSRTLTTDDLRAGGSLNQAAPAGGGRPNVVRPSPRTRTLTPRGTRFTPGISSSGRLEPTLAPVPVASPTIAG
jgi:hypothetical protein